MDKATTVHLLYGILLDHKKGNEILSYAMKSSELETFMLTEISQSSKNKYHMFSSIQDSLYVKKIVFIISISSLFLEPVLTFRGTFTHLSLVAPG